jgi:dTDP-glucose 4,6-dehydratase
MQNKTFFITGGLGFIGKHFIIKCLQADEIINIINIDCYSYAADRKTSKEFKEYQNYLESREFIHNLGYLPICDYVINFAAESHVDNSIADSSKFINTNIGGTHHLLELIRKMPESHRPHFIQISTDEVYGDSKNGEIFDETSLLKPSSPYAASKAAADQLVMAYGRTYGINYNIIRMSNCFGHNQYPEKLIPTICMNLVKGKPIPLHGDGSYIRTWLHVEEAVQTIIRIIEDGEANNIYNIAGNYRKTNLEIANIFLQFEKLDKSYIKFIPNRLGQDLDYHINGDKVLNISGLYKIKPLEFLLEDIYNHFDIDRFYTR